MPYLSWIAGLKVWPKRWQNLRATRATELERIFPSHVVTGWCGHTERIAEQHYWMTTESDFARASTLKSDAHMMQHGAEGSGTGSQATQGTKEESPEKPGSAKPCTVVRKTPMEDRGLEPGNENAGSHEEQADSDAHMMHWAELRRQIERCPDLPAEVKRRLIMEREAAAAG